MSITICIDVRRASQNSKKKLGDMPLEANTPLPLQHYAIARQIHRILKTLYIEIPRAGLENQPKLDEFSSSNETRSLRAKRRVKLVHSHPDSFDTMYRNPASGIKMIFLFLGGAHCTSLLASILTIKTTLPITAIALGSISGWYILFSAQYRLMCPTEHPEHPLARGPGVLLPPISRIFNVSNGDLA
ncbi:hypothetical protein C8R43DRAFT_958118 [Mycena crocata]|nr:hypothetical protein C8R43DRAFT_958118 [Mycena crocata]